MSPVSHIYVFDKFELDEQAGTVHVKDDPVELTSTEYKLLLFLVKNPKKRHRYSDLYEEVFGLMGRSKSNTIPQHVSNLNKKLQAYSENDLIANIPNFGYRFDADVTIKSQSTEIPIISDEIETTIGNEVADDDTSVNKGINEDTEDCSNHGDLGNKGMIAALSGIVISILLLTSAYASFDYTNNLLSKTLFIGIASFCYGCLNVVGLILECAYEFDKYRTKALRMIPTVFLINSASVFAGFIFADRLLQNGSISAFWIGLVFLIFGVVISCICGYFVLPNTPIVKATVQTQPAFAAFCKNILFYFLPLCSVFGLLIYCFLYGSSPLTKIIAFPIMFGILWLFVFAGSLYSTFYFTDKLLVVNNGKRYKYYELYFSLLIIRAAFFFGPTAAAVIWYLIFLLNYY